MEPFAVTLVGLGFANKCPPEWGDYRAIDLRRASGISRLTRKMILVDGYRSGFGKWTCEDLDEYKDVNWIPRVRETRRQGNRRFV